ncbi:MAG: hypothetical protein R2864_04845 [Syntrophotaleaceae bacterium]
MALQFLGNLFEYLLKEQGEDGDILGATSGDTGSAAIYGVRGKDNINIFILHPHQKVSADSGTADDHGRRTSTTWPFVALSTMTAHRQKFLAIWSSRPTFPWVP